MAAYVWYGLLAALGWLVGLEHLLQPAPGEQYTFTYLTVICIYPRHSPASRQQFATLFAASAALKEEKKRSLQLPCLPTCLHASGPPVVLHLKRVSVSFAWPQPSASLHRAAAPALRCSQVHFNGGHNGPKTYSRRWYQRQTRHGVPPDLGLTSALCLAKRSCRYARPSWGRAA